MKELNPENKCSTLYRKVIPKEDSLKIIFENQVNLQKLCGCFKENMDFKERLEQIDKHWRNLCVEFGEFMQRLPYKEWKKYSEEKKNGVFGEEEKLEIWYEYIDMAHFFFNIGIYLGLNWEDFFSLYYTKNEENFSRQNRNY